MDDPFDPRQLPGGGRSLALAFELCGALALLDGEEPLAWRRCRSAALRYVDAVRGGRLGHDAALALLRAAIRTWVPRSLDPARRARLDARVPFWVGTVYGLRWDADVRGRASAPADPAPRSAPPRPWSELRAQHRTLHAAAAQSHERGRLGRAALDARWARTLELVATAETRVRERRRVVAESRAWRDAAAGAPPRSWAVPGRHAPPAAATDARRDAE